MTTLSQLQAFVSSHLQDAVRGDFNDLAKLLIDRGALVYDADQVCLSVTTCALLLLIIELASAAASGSALGLMLGACACAAAGAAGQVGAEGGLNQHPVKAVRP